MASPCRAGAGRSDPACQWHSFHYGGWRWWVIPARPGRPFRHSCGRWWKCDPARPWRHIPPRLALVVVIRRVQGVPPSASAAAGGDPVTSRASPSSTAGAGGAEGRGRARLWWYSILSTRYIGMWFYRPVTTIRRVIRPDFCVNANLQNFFRVNDNLQKFFMGDLCVNANQH